MRVAIIGAGQVGQALGRAFRRAGHIVTFGIRDPDRGRDDAQPIRDAVVPADLSILAVPFAAAAGILSDPVFDGRIVVDATNPLSMGEQGLGLSLGFSTSGAEQIAAASPGVRLVKAFNQTGFENMEDATVYRARPIMFVASDHSDASAAVIKLAEDAGFEALDIGGLRQSRLLEPFAMLWIELARKRGLGPDFAFNIERKGTR